MGLAAIPALQGAGTGGISYRVWHMHHVVLLMSDMRVHKRVDVFYA